MEIMGDGKEEEIYFVVWVKFFVIRVNIFNFSLNFL